MKKLFILGLITGFFATDIQAQDEAQLYKFDRNLSAHVGIGGVNYKGDLVEDNEFQLKGNFNVGLKYRTSNRFSLRADLTWYSFSSNDVHTERGLEFETSNIELAVSGVVDFFAVASPYTDRPSFNAYGVLGIGVTTMNPKVDGTPIRELNTIEGDFASAAFTVPAGLGATFRVSDNIDLSAEGSYHFMFTDYLDGVSERGDSAQNDGFATITFRASFFLNRKNPLNGVVQ